MGSSDPTGPVKPFQKWATALLLIVGMEFWLILGQSVYPNTRQQWLLLVALLVSLVPPVARWFSNQLDRLRNPSPSTRAIITIVITILSTIYFIFTARYQHRPMVLTYLDEHSYAIGVQMAARFRFWMPAHDIGDFFEAMQLLVHPVYASPYFPGTAMLFAPSVWLGLPHWFLPGLAAGACVGLTYRIVAELLDSLGGLLCAMILSGSSIFRLVSVMLLSQTPVLMLALLTIFFWLRWRQNRRWAWAILIGIFSGWCLITRPIDAVAMLLPAACGFAIDLKEKQLQTIASLAVGALPFIIIQLIFNVGVTGSLIRTPFQLSQSMDYPQVGFGFPEFDPSIKPQTSLPQKLDHYDTVTVPAMKAHRPNLNWLPAMFERALPNSALLLLAPVGFLASGRRRWLLITTIPIWIALYTLYTFKFPHYIVPLMPMLAMVIVCGVEQIRSAWPMLRSFTTMLLVCSILILTLTNLAELNSKVHDQWFDASDLAQVDAVLSKTPQTPAVVLFTYDPKQPSEADPVFNTQTAWPDDAAVIRARDLGSRNVEIFDYYAKHQPQRAFYTYDRAEGSLKFMGLAKDLGHAR